ncbi:MAG: prepilin peptidase [Planctomycetes bacterium]|nr:prepilin peptidase [Planctomycetota bacterium]
MDTITIYCGKCGEELKVKAVDAGGVMRCTKCRVRIPIPSTNLDRPQIRVFCPKCGARLRGWPNEAGKQVECRRCKKIISLPHIKEPGAEGRTSREARKKDRGKTVYSFTDEEDGKIEKEEVKIEPVKKRRAADVPVLSFSDDDVDVGGKKTKESKPMDKEDEDEEEMISFDEFLVDDVAKPGKKKRKPPRDGEKRRKPKLSPDEEKRATSDTDALPPAKVGRKNASPPETTRKTLVVDCEECGMRLVFRNGRKPHPSAVCPACGEKLVV